MKKQVTVVPIDGVIIVESEPLIFTFEAPATMHALQWKNEQGHIEFIDGRKNFVLTKVDYVEQVLPYVQLWKIEKARLEAEANIPSTLEETVANKYAEIIRGSDAVHSFLHQKFSEVEGRTWPEQEAGARAILKQEDIVQDTLAGFILSAPDLREKAVQLIENLAHIDGVSVQDFALRVVANADAATRAKELTLKEQRGYESSLKKLSALGEGENEKDAIVRIATINVQYSVLG